MEGEKEKGRKRNMYKCKRMLYPNQKKRKDKGKKARKNYL